MSARKPAESRQRGSRTRDVGVPPARLVGSVPAVPSSEKPLLKVTREAWVAFWSTEPLAALVMPADRSALDRLFRMYDMRERMERMVARQPFMEGSTGQPVVNPAAKEVASLDGRILALEDRFGITPMARLKLGIAFGEASRSLDRLNEGFDSDDADGDDLEDEDPRRAIDI
jgi:P27 family predicted phage terminase small subunit